ncbi:MAG: metallophosphoesterase [Bacteroidales bacterium]
MQFLIFFSIVLIVYFAGNWFVYHHGRLAFEDTRKSKQVYTWFFWILSITFPAGRILEEQAPSIFSEILLWIGSFWLAFLLYSFLSSLLIFFFRLSNRIKKWFPGLFYQAYFKRIGFYTLLIFISGLILYGYYNAQNVQTTNLNINFNPEAAAYQDIHAVVISDVHLSSMIKKKQFSRIVHRIQGLNPDIIMIAGDLVDGDLEAVIRHNSLQPMEVLKPPLGIYAVTGNHEYIGGVEKAVSYLKRYNIQFLRDTAILIDSSFYLIGREDIESKRFRGKPRKPLAQITRNLNSSLPRILLDHQPATIEESRQQNIDLLLSGHTHHGQLWPLGMITKALFLNDYGHTTFGQLHTYTSSGAGTWGPPVKIGSKAEIVSIQLRL